MRHCLSRPDLRTRKREGNRKKHQGMHRMLRVRQCMPLYRDRAQLLLTHTLKRSIYGEKKGRGPIGRRMANRRHRRIIQSRWMVERLVRQTRHPPINLEEFCLRSRSRQHLRKSHRNGPPHLRRCLRCVHPRRRGPPRIPEPRNRNTPRQSPHRLLPLKEPSLAWINRGARDRFFLCTTRLSTNAALHPHAVSYGGMIYAFPKGFSNH